MKNLLNSMRKQGGKPICKAEIVCRSWKTTETLARKTERKTECWLIDWLIEDKNEKLLEALD